MPTRSMASLYCLESYKQKTPAKPAGGSARNGGGAPPTETRRYWEARILPGPGARPCKTGAPSGSPSAPALPRGALFRRGLRLAFAISPIAGFVQWSSRTAGENFVGEYLWMRKKISMRGWGDWNRQKISGIVRKTMPSASPAPTMAAPDPARPQPACSRLGAKTDPGRYRPDPGGGVHLHHHGCQRQISGRPDAGRRDRLGPLPLRHAGAAFDAAPLWRALHHSQPPAGSAASALVLPALLDRHLLGGGQVHSAGGRHRHLLRRAPDADGAVGSLPQGKGRAPPLGRSPDRFWRCPDHYPARSWHGPARRLAAARLLICLRQLRHLHPAARPQRWVDDDPDLVLAPRPSVAEPLGSRSIGSRPIWAAG